MSHYWFKKFSVTCILFFGIQGVHCKTIIWDLGDTLVERSTLSELQAVGLWNAFKLYWQQGNNIPSLMRLSLWEIMNLYGKVPRSKTDIPLDPYGYPLPQLMQDWFLGNKTSYELARITKDLAEKYTGFTSPLHKEVVKSVLDWMFTPERYGASWVPKPRAVGILKKAARLKDKNGNKLHRNLILSNFDADTFRFFSQNPANKIIFKHFDPDDIFISAQVGDMKPRSSIFESVLRKKNIRPEDAILIDDQEENCQMARKAGAQAIHVQYGDFTHVPAELRKHGVHV